MDKFRRQICFLQYLIFQTATCSCPVLPRFADCKFSVQSTRQLVSLTHPTTFYSCIWNFDSCNIPVAVILMSQSVQSFGTVSMLELCGWPKQTFDLFPLNSWSHFRPVQPPLCSAVEVCSCTSRKCFSGAHFTFFITCQNTIFMKASCSVFFRQLKLDADCVHLRFEYQA